MPAFPLLLVFFKPRHHIAEQLWVHGKADEQCRWALQGGAGRQAGVPKAPASGRCGRALRGCESLSVQGTSGFVRGWGHRDELGPGSMLQPLKSF